MSLISGIASGIAEPAMVSGLPFMGPQRKEKDPYAAQNHPGIKEGALCHKVACD